MKLKKLAAGVLAAVVAVTSVVVTPVIAGAANSYTVISESVSAAGAWGTVKTIEPGDTTFSEMAKYENMEISFTLSEAAIEAATGNEWMLSADQCMKVYFQDTDGTNNSNGTMFGLANAYGTTLDTTTVHTVTIAIADLLTDAYTVVDESALTTGTRMIFSNGQVESNIITSVKLVDPVDAPEYIVIDEGVSATGAWGTVKTIEPGDTTFSEMAKYENMEISFTLSEAAIEAATGNEWMLSADQCMKVYFQDTDGTNNSNGTMFGLANAYGTTLDTTTVHTVTIAIADLLTDAYTVVDESALTTGTRMIFSNGQVESNIITSVKLVDPVLDTTVYATEITLSETKLALKKGDNTDNTVLTATVGPEDATDKTVTWSSSDSNIVRVNTDGTLTALNNGTATITATANGADPNGTPVSASCEITVTNPAQYISLDKTSLELKTGETYTFTVTPTPEDADEYELVWTIIENTPSYDKGVDVISVDENGKVTALNPGSAAVRAAVKGNENVSIDCMITVTSPVTGITFEQDTMELTKGDVAGIAFNVAPENASNTNISWSSDNTSVATVDESGNVTAVASGTATITATTEDGGFTATCKITVTDPETDVPETDETVDVPETDETVDVPETDETVDVPETDETVDVPETGETVDVPETDETVDVPETDETVDVPETDETVDVPETDETVDVPETDETVDVPETDETVDVPETGETVDVPETDETVDVPETDETVDVPETEETLDEGTYGDGEYAQIPESEIPEMPYDSDDISDSFTDVKAVTSSAFIDGRLYIYSQYTKKDIALHEKSYIVVKHKNGKTLKLTTGCAYTQLKDGVKAADGCLFLAFVISNISDDPNDALYYGNFTWTDIVLE